MPKPVLQAGGIVVRKSGNRLSVLLVRAKSDPSIWIFPKGHIERGETASEAALRETEEEAGITGELLGPVGEPVEFHNGRYLVRAQYYAIRPRSESPKTDGRAKKWFAFDDALEAVHFDEDRQLLREAAALVRRRPGGER